MYDYILDSGHLGYPKQRQVAVAKQRQVAVAKQKQVTTKRIVHEREMQ